MRRLQESTQATRRIRRWVVAGALLAGLTICQPASAEPLTAAATAAPTTVEGTAAGVQSATEQLTVAEHQVEAATTKAQQLAYAVVALHDELATAQTQAAAARADARTSIRAAIDQADIDPTETLFAALNGDNPGLATQVRNRQLGDMATRTKKLSDAIRKLNALGREMTTRLAAANVAAAQALSSADKARTVLAAAQKTDEELRAKVALQAQQAELDRLTAQLAESLAAVSASAGSAAGYAPITASNLPASLRALYMRGAAAECPGLPWNVLAGIGQVETDHGQNKNVSSAGAMGPMQFMPATWAVYGIDGDGDGVADILDQADAIYSAAHYLCADGGGNSATLYQAIFAYNHSDYYVNTVLAVAAQYH